MQQSPSTRLESHGRPRGRCLAFHGCGIQIKTPAVCATTELGQNGRVSRIRNAEMERFSRTTVWLLLKTPIMSLWCDGFGDVKKPDPNAPEEPGARSQQRKVQET
ncbi:hypothetical protein WAI453_011543 [Rhynchosporium graminicola]